MPKKGISTPVFKYIFMLATGALILLFFIKFAADMTTTKQSISKTETGQIIDNSLTALTASEDQTETIPQTQWPEDLELTIGKGATCGEFTTGTYNQETSNIIFSATTLKDKQIQAWTKSWKYPFKTENFFYLTNKKTKYYLVYGQDQDTEKFVKSIDSAALPTDTLEHIPKQFMVESITANQIEQRLSEAKGKYEFVKFIFFKTQPPKNFKGKYTIIEYKECEEEKDDDECRGRITSGQGETYFIGKEMMYGAILAEDLEAYKCQQTRAIKRLNMMISIYKEKAKLLEQKTNCDYASMRNTLEEMGKLTTNPDEEKLNIERKKLVEGNDRLGEESECTQLF